jgi:hypothetical protein
VTLDGTDSIAAVNNLDPVTDPLFPNSPNYISPLPALQFGETAIDLAKAGVFSANTCTAFGSTFVRSRSSASFTAEVKDFIAPIPVNIANCGQIVIHKTTVPSPDPTGTTFNYTTTGGLTPSTFGLKDGGTEDYGKTVQQGSYSVSESNPGPNFALSGLDCSASVLTHGSTATVSGGTVNIVLKPLDTVECTYTNTLQQGAIKITKTSSKAAGTPLAGAKFSITSGGNPIAGSPFTTDANGTICVDGLNFGDYSVTETAAPGGYAIDDGTAHTVTVDNNAKCSDATFVGEARTFTDTPLTDVVVKATSEASGGTKSKITCVDSGSKDVGNSPQGFDDPVQVTANGLKPGTYTCTVVVDP